MRREIDAAEVRRLLQQPYRFGECVELQNCTVRGALEIRNAQICGIDFSGCVFEDQVIFYGSVFQGLSWFKDVEFYSSVNCAHTRFSGDARFDNVRFVQGADFSMATFWGVGCFDGVVARKQVLMNKIDAYGNLSMARSNFQSLVLITDSTLMGGLWMPGTDIEELQGLDQCTVQGRFEC